METKHILHLTVCRANSEHASKACYYLRKDSQGVYKTDDDIPLAVSGENLSWVEDFIDITWNELAKKIMEYQISNQYCNTIRITVESITTAETSSLQEARRQLRFMKAIEHKERRRETI